jgi:pilus assembly protein CpaF
MNADVSRLELRPISPELRRVIDEVRNRVGDLLADWVSAEAKAGRKKDSDDRREYARVLVKKELELRNAQLLAGGRDAMPEADRVRAAQEVVARLTGAGALQTLMDRTDWTDIHVYGTQVTIVHVDGQQTDYGTIASSPKEVADLIRILAATSGQTSRQFNSSNPILSMTLSTGERLTAVTDVVSTGVTATIRRNSTPNITLDQLAKSGSISTLAASFIKAMIALRLNWVVSGGTGTGKTTFLRAAGQEFGPDERIVTIEDAFELRLRSDRLRQVVELETREANVEGVGALTMVQLAKSALRMTPTRVILGELRGAECESFIDACTQGQSGSCCTVHSDSSEDTPYRLRWFLAKAMPNMTPASLTDAVAQAVELIVHIEKHGDERFVTSIREITGREEETFITQEIFSIDQRTGKLEPTGVISGTLRQRLARVGFDAARLGLFRS